MATSTLTLTSALASLTGLASVTYVWESTRTPATVRDGHARASLARTLTVALTATPEGREALDALTAGPATLRPIHDAIMYAQAEAWKDKGRNAEAVTLAMAGKGEWPDATPRLAQYARRALATWQAQEAAKVAKVTPVATPPTPYTRPTLTLATIQAHMAQAGTMVARATPPAWKGRQVA